MAANAVAMLLQAAGVAVDEITSQMVALAHQAMTELGITEPDVRSATASEFETQARTVLMDIYREQALADAESSDPDAFVYLGPDDKVTRDFCEELVGTQLTADEIDELDNGEGTDCMTTGGGWNCRHQWLPLYGSQADEYPRGDVEAANAAAEGG